VFFEELGPHLAHFLLRRIASHHFRQIQVTYEWLFSETLDLLLVLDREASRACRAYEAERLEQRHLVEQGMHRPAGVRLDRLSVISEPAPVEFIKRDAWSASQWARFRLGHHVPNQLGVSVVWQPESLIADFCREYDI